jgi:hypothetical protein
MLTASAVVFAPTVVVLQQFFSRGVLQGSIKA